MTRISLPASIDAAPEASQPLLEGVNKMLGSVPNLFRLTANSPAALEGYLGLNGALAKGALMERNTNMRTTKATGFFFRTGLMPWLSVRRASLSMAGPSPCVIGQINHKIAALRKTESTELRMPTSTGVCSINVGSQATSTVKTRGIKIFLSVIEVN